MARLVAVGVVAFCLGAGWAHSCATSEAQSPEVADAIEYGIALGLPRTWAYRVSWCESRYQPGAYNRRSGASGLFQFMPRTFAATPQGRAGMSVFDPYANAAAAAWLYRTYGPGQWRCR